MERSVDSKPFLLLLYASIHCDEGVRIAADTTNVYKQLQYSRQLTVPHHHTHQRFMPLPLSGDAPTLFIMRSAFERVQLTRQQIDEALGLTPDEFRMEGQLIAIGPLFGDSTLTDLIESLELRGLVYYDDFFELSGNWPEWLKLFAMS